MFRKLFVGSVLVLFFSFQAIAETQYGGYLSQGHYVIDDSVGKTETALFTGISFVMSLDGSHRDLRWLWGGGAIFDHQIEGEASHPGLAASRIFVEGSFQKRFRLSSAFKPWLGLGVNLGQDEFVLRHTVDQNGFLFQQLEDKEQTKIGFLLNLNQEFVLGQKAQWGYKMEYLAVSDSFNGLSVGLTFFY